MEPSVPLRLDDVFQPVASYACLEQGTMGSSGCSGTVWAKYHLKKYIKKKQVCHHQLSVLSAELHAAAAFEESPT